MDGVTTIVLTICLTVLTVLVLEVVGINFLSRAIGRAWNTGDEFDEDAFNDFNDDDPNEYDFTNREEGAT